MFSSIGRHGNCVPYRQQDLPSICDRFYTSGVDFVYDPYERDGDIYTLLRSLNRILLLIQSTLEDCNGPIVEVLCHFWFPPCGNTSVVKSPTSVCEEACRYVFGLCSEQWQEILDMVEENGFITGDSGLSSINCSNTGEYLEPLPHCCSYVGVEIRMSVPYLSYISSTIQNKYI